MARPSWREPGTKRFASGTSLARWGPRRWCFLASCFWYLPHCQQQVISLLSLSVGIRVGAEPLHQDPVVSRSSAWRAEWIQEEASCLHGPSFCFHPSDRQSPVVPWFHFSCSALDTCLGQFPTSFRGMKPPAEQWSLMTGIFFFLHLFTDWITFNLPNGLSFWFIYFLLF